MSDPPLKECDFCTKQFPKLVIVWESGRPYQVCAACKKDHKERHG